MKKRSFIKFIICWVLIFSAMGNVAMAKKTEEEKVLAKLKLLDGNDKPIANVPVLFFNQEKEKDKKVFNAKTDETGKVEIWLEKEKTFLVKSPTNKNLEIGTLITGEKLKAQNVNGKIILLGAPLLTWKTDPSEGNILQKNQIFHLRIEAYDPENDPFTVTWSVNGGEIKEHDNLNANWKTPDTEGSYTVTITAEDDKGNKNTLEGIFQVKTIEVIDEKMKLGLKDELPDGEDYDNDGITNKEEKTNGTNPRLKDTDGDKLSDNEEINQYKTNPKQSDTDNDGMTDGEEVYFKTNPLVKDTDANGLEDGKEEYTYKTENSEAKVKINITGPPSIASNTELQVFNNDFVTNSYGMVGKVIEVTSPDTKNATLTFSYSEDEINHEGLNENELSIFWLDEENKTLVPVTSVLDTSNNTVTANVTHFSKYFVADKTEINKDLSKVDIMFVLDQSGSMINNDPENKRIDASKSIVKGLNGDLRYGVISFTSYPTRVLSLTNQKEDVLNALESLRGNAGGGTMIGSAINHGINQFDTNNSRKVMILLTDGEDSYVNEVLKAVNTAKERKIQIYTIGLGNGVNSDLLRNSVAIPTGGKYFQIDQADNLISAFQSIMDNLSLEKETIRYGEKERSVKLIEKSSFDPAVDGFGFRNSSDVQAPGGMCHGFASISHLYYQDKFPLYEKEGDQASPTTGIPGYDLRLNVFFTYPVRNNLTDYKVEIEEEADRASNWYEKDGEYLLTKSAKEYLKPLGYLFGKTHSGVEYADLDLNSEGFRTNDLWNEDRDMVAAIHWWWDNQSGKNQRELTLETLVKEIQDHGTAVVQFWGGDEGHSITAFGVYQDTTDLNTYYVAIYDNNFPNQTNYLRLKREKTFWGNVEYTIHSDHYDFEDGATNLYDVL